MKGTLIFLLTFGYSFCAPQVKHLNYERNLIVGGHAAEAVELPFIGVIYSPIICGCSIITVNFAITAAHCTFKPVNDYKVRFGSNHRTSGGTTTTVVSFQDHPRYDKLTLDYDYSLMKLYNSLYFNSNVKAIKLPGPGENFATGTTAFIAGFGRTEEGGRLSSSLQTAEISISDFDRCKHNYELNNRILTNQMMCAGSFDGGINTCKGDSGGPLFIQKNGEFVLVGITSWTFGCARESYPTVFAKVSQVSDWINNILVTDTVTFDYSD